MRIAITLVIAFGVLLGAAAKAEPVKDIAGWSDTRWRMSPDELTRLYPNFSIGFDNDGFKAGRLPNVTIGGTQFQVYLGFEGVGGMRMAWSLFDPPTSQWRLLRVKLRNPDANACNRVTASLLGKYGQPTSHESGFYLWVLPTTTVRQVWRNDCLIIYHPTE